MSERIPAPRAPQSRIIRTSAIALLLAGTSLAAAHAGTKVGWVWADQPDAAGVYTPDASYSYNSSGGAVTVTPQGVGVYRVSFDGLKTSQTTNAIATAYGTNGYCNVSNWSPNGGTSEGVTVNCFNAAGAPANSYFTLLYQSHGGIYGSAAKGTAYLWANDPSAASYTPSTSYQFNSRGGTNTITRSSTGNYRVSLPGFDKVGGHIQVSAYGASAARCKVTGWESDVSGTTVGVVCFDAAGAAADQQFTFAFSRALAIGYESSGASVGVYGWASYKKRLHYKLPGTYQFNGFGTGKLTAERGGKGVYSVSIPGTVNYDSSNMLVTGYGTDNSYCTISYWEPLAVGCYKQGGNPVDAQFNVDFQVSGTVVAPQH